MPLFMDYHKMEHVTVEEVKTALIADESIQEQYGVRYHQFWVNEETGSVCCLMEGPDKATCEEVHRQSHGNMACAITEVEPGFFNMIMGNNHAVDQGHMKHRNVGIDLGYRNIMVVNIHGHHSGYATPEFREILKPVWARHLILDEINVFEGRQILWDKDNSIIGVFNAADNAVQCALSIQDKLIHFNDRHPAVIFSVGISASQPVTESGEFFNAAIRFAQRLSNVAGNNEILLSCMVSHLCKEDSLLFNHPAVKTLKIEEEKFITELFQIAEENLTDHSFTLDKLSHEVCVSRPQLYRKIVALTGRSPHDFLHDLRMEKALFLLGNHAGNIAEVAFEVGYHNPSYFTRCFIEKYGCAPSVFKKSPDDK